MFEFKTGLNPHLVASVLKKYIRDRPFSTVPYRCYRSAILIHDALPDKYAPFSVEECKAFIDSLPDDKPDLFRLVVSSLKKVSVYKEQTKMGLSNLAIVWAPVLMRCHGDGLSLFSESDRQTDFLIRIMELIDDITKEEEPSEVLSASPGSPGGLGDEKTPEKRKHHKHHHHHHHRHGHSHSRSSRRKSESANSSPTLSPNLPPLSPDCLSSRSLRQVSEEASCSRRRKKMSAVDVKVSPRMSDDLATADTPSSTVSEFSTIQTPASDMPHSDPEPVDEAAKPADEAAKPVDEAAKPEESIATQSQ